MLSEKAIKQLEKQQYRVIGSHSAVKICGWTKNLLRGRGGCYKLVFYGIKSHQCLQMTTSMSCANRCTFCWRDYKAPVSKEWKWQVDDPVMIVEESIKAQEKLLLGFGGFEKTPKKLYAESKEVRHVALSLTGEPITYPRINELVQEFHRRKVSTFIVTNSQYPEHIKNLVPITQLYCSVDAPNKELLKKIDVPLFDDYWERMLKSLEYLSQRTDRTAIRLTLIKNENMCDLEGYKSLIELGDPDFIEVKAYMWIGASQLRLKREQMPSHEEVKAFGMELLKMLPAYEYVNEHKPSNVILLAKKSFGGNTQIDFEKFFADLAKQ